MTLSMQETFDKVVTHLREQNTKSIIVSEAGDTKCLYRGSNNLKCAVGCLIPDDMYVPAMDQTGRVSTLLMKFPELMPIFGQENISVLERLQSVHDASDVDFWENEFANIAKRFQLTLQPRI